MEMLIYLLKVNLAIIVFTIFYRLFYSKDTFFSLRRYLLLSILMLSACYPLMDFSQWMIRSATVTRMAVSYTNMLPEVVVYASDTAGASASAPVSFLTWTLWIYMAVACFFILRILWRTMQIAWLRFQSQAVVIQGIKVLRLKNATPPFSFFSWIFIHPEMHDERELQEILAHESVHVRQRHSLDVVASEMACALCWINPMAWMLKKEIRKNLEFIVDHSIVSRHRIDVKKYQYHLLKLTYHPSKMMLVNQFNISPLKERIMMINEKKSPKMRLAAYTLVLPLALLFLAVNNVGAVAERMNLTTVAQTKQELSGVILDKATKKPIRGVSIVVKGTTAGTISDVAGCFKLSVNETDSVVFTFIGYTALKMSAQNLLATNPMILEMSREAVGLGPVTVVAFGTKKGPASPTTANPPGVTVVAFGTKKDVSSEPASTASEQATPQPTSEAKDIPETYQFMVVEEMPKFPGGQSELMKFISDNLTYPQIALENDVEGTVVCKFIIREDGSVYNAHVDFTLDPSLDKEALRVINKMPKWEPGKQRGMPVPVEYSVPIEFRISKSQ